MLLTINILVKVATFLFNKKKEDDKKKETSDQAVVLKLVESVDELKAENKDLKYVIKELRIDLAGLPRYERDLWRNFLAIKMIAGEKWPKILDEIKREEDALKRPPN